MAVEDLVPLVVRPLTVELWPAFTDLLDEGGPAGRCWCMATRIGAEYRRRPAEDNRSDFRSVVEDSPSPGLLAFRDELAVGWCQLTSRDAVPAVDRAWRTRRVDDVPAWLLSCFYVRKGHRRHGVTATLVSAALERARAAGAPAVEAYPLDAAVSPSATATGFVSTFVAAGFVEIARASPERPLLRFTFS